MANLFKLFDGSMAAGGAASTQNQTNDALANITSESEALALELSASDSIELLVDYSDFSNFVTFNSAESYVTLTADEILSSYPYDKSALDYSNFLLSLDGFQKYFLQNWPSTSGHLRFDPSVSSSYVRFDDFGVQDGVGRTSFFSPGTGSFSVQGWVHVPNLTGSNDVQVIIQKLKQGTTDGISVYVSASALYFQVSSGSNSVTLNSSITQNPFFFAGVLDRSQSTGSVKLITATTGTFPVIASTSSIVLSTRFDLASGSFFIGSGSVASKNVIPFTGSVESLSLWSTARSLTDLTGTFNRKIRAQSGLVALWRFNDSTINTPSDYASIVKDSSGHRLDGRIQRFFTNVIGSGTFIYDELEPVLSIYDANVTSYIVNAQVSGVLYDRNNANIIWNLFPSAFSQTDPTSADVFKNFALIIARNFDRIKLYINQLSNLRNVKYSDYDQAPDELLDQVGKFFGWNHAGSFINSTPYNFVDGRGILANTANNSKSQLSLQDIKHQLQRRFLLNLPYIYKTKGTAESIQSLIRSYGLNESFVRLKEYAKKNEVTANTAYVNAEKSVYALRFDSGRIAYGTSPTSQTTTARTLVLQFGQSNAESHTAASALSPVNQWITASLSSIQTISQQDKTFGDDPMIWQYAGPQALGPITFDLGGGNASCMGFELSMMRDLSLALPSKNFSHARIAVGGASSVQFDPSGSYPTVPANGSNLYRQIIGFVTSSYSTLQCTQMICVWEQGEGDAKTTQRGSDYLGWLAKFVEALRRDLGNIGPNGGVIPFIYGRLNAQADPSTYLGLSQLRSSQASFQTVSSSLKMVDQDSVTTGSGMYDGTHYTADGYVAVGHLFSPAVASYLGIRIQPSASFTYSTNLLTASFTDASVSYGDTITAWRWDFGDGVTSSLQNPSHGYSADGTFAVSLTASNSVGDSNISLPVQVSVAGGIAGVSRDSLKKWYVPETFSEWQTFLTASSLTAIKPPNMGHLMQEASGNPADIYLRVPLTASSTPFYQTTVSGWTRKAITMTDGTAKQLASTNSQLPDISTTSMLTLAYVLVPSSSPAASRNIVSLGTSASTRSSAVITSAGKVQATSTSANTQTGASSICDGTVHAICIKVDRTNSADVVYTDVEKLTPTFGSTMTGKGIYLGAQQGGLGALAGGYLYEMTWFGTAAEMTDSQVKSLIQALTGLTLTWS